MKYVINEFNLLMILIINEFNSLMTYVYVNKEFTTQGWSLIIIEL